MDRSGSVSDIMDVENQLSQVREQIETLEADVKTMRAQVAFSTIAINLTAEAGAEPVEPTTLAQLGSAVRAAWHSVSRTTVLLLAALVWVAAYAPYALVAFLAGLFFYRRLVVARR